MTPKKSIFILIVLVTSLALTHAEQVNWQGPAGITIKDVKYPDQNIPQTDFTVKSFSAPAAVTVTPYPEPPLAGFSPLIVIATSNKENSGDDTFEHVLRDSYIGTPLNPPLAENYIIGVYDSGTEVDLFAGTSAVTLGLTGSNLTEYTFPLGGVGGTIDAVISEPIGVFAGSLSTIQPNGLLDPNGLVGHSNVEVVVSPEISCDTGESISGVVGTPMISFYTAVIRNDYIHQVFYDGQYLTGPDIQILDPDDPSIPEYSHQIAMSFSGLATTANFYLDDLFGLLNYPTLLSAAPGSLPTGGKFIATIYALEGTPSPTNIIQPMRVMVDTGAQSSIISPAMAANLSLPLQGDFTVDVCGVGGTEPNVPGYFVDYVKINALGGAMEFSNAPFVVIDLPIQDASGNYLDGVLGMNFFWDRNIIFAPNLFGSGFLHVSDPISYGNADFDFDGSVNLIDFSMLASAWASQQPEAEYLPVCDLYLDGQINIKDLEAFMEHWLE